MTQERHQLNDVRVGDDPSAWAAAGFAVGGCTTVIDRTRISLDGADGDRGITTVGIDGLQGAVDGIALHESGEPVDAPATHPNGTVAIDHLVMMTPDCDRTTADIERAGVEPRRVRRFELGGTPRRQTFFWLGNVILELVGPDRADGTGPPELWGLALTTADIDATAAFLGDRCSPPKDAVQPGRRIATLDTRALDISIAIAFMSPHPGRSKGPR